MATAAENCKVAVEKSAEPDPPNAEPISSEELSNQQSNMPEQANTETVSSDQIESEPVSKETTDSQQASTDPRTKYPTESEPVTKYPMSEPEPVTKEPTESEPVTKVPTESELVTKEPKKLEVVHTQHFSKNPATSDSTEAEQVSQRPGCPDVSVTEAGYIEPMTKDQADAEEVQYELPNTEQAGAQPPSSEKVYSHSEKEKPAAESPNPQLISSDNADSGIASESVDSMPVDPQTQANLSNIPSNEENSELDQTEQAIHAEHMNVDQHVTPSQLPQHVEFVHSEPASSEQVNNKSVSLEQTHQQPIGQDMMYSHHLDGSEMMSSQPLGSELKQSQPLNSEHAHQEFANSQPLDDTVEPGMYSMEGLPIENDEMVKMERVHTEPMDTDAVSSELEHQLHPSSELQIQVSSELDHQLQLSTELVHLHPVGTELVHSQPVSSELVLSHPLGSKFHRTEGSQLMEHHDISTMQIVSADVVPAEATDPETTLPNKRRKKKSIVWEHFTIENVGAGCRRACCKVCKQSFAYSTGSKVAGTSHLKRHIAKGSCPLIFRQQQHNQLTPYTPKSSGGGGTEGAATEPPTKRRYRTANSPYLIFDQEHCRREIAKMIIMHDYPLHMVEHPGFVAFVSSLQPRFDMVNSVTVRGDCVATYLREKQILQKSIDNVPGRICLMLDMWGSPQTTGYVYLSGQFIDQDWKLHRRLLNVVMEPFPESDRAFSHAVATCLSYWNLENKLCSITFNQQMSEAALSNMRGLLCVKNPSLLNGQLLVGSCLARALSDMAQEVFVYGQNTLKKIRASVKYVKTSDGHEERFIELKQQLQIPSDKSLYLDNTTRWDTTYHMLKAASALKEVFLCLDTSDPDYKDAPTMEDWRQAEGLCFFLKHFYDTANFLLAETPHPSNIFFHEVWKIQLELAHAASSEDMFESELAKRLQDKFLEYWRNSFLILAISVAMDPRFKLKLVEFSFTKLFGQDANSYIRVVDGGIHELFHEYIALPLPLTPAYAEDGSSRDVKTDGDDQQGGNLISGNGLSDFDMYIMETTSQQMKSELDMYLEESLLPRIPDFDVLGWWKLNRLKYPTLSKMARDILTIPLSSVGPESVFDMVGREMDQYRSSLRPETLEALICAKNWLQYASDTSSSLNEVTNNGQLRVEL